MVTTAIAEVQDARGCITRMVASSRHSLTPAQRCALRPGEIAVTGVGHAESKLLFAATRDGTKILKLSTTRPPCKYCRGILEREGIAIVESANQNK
jgi:hypothetical protein